MTRGRTRHDGNEARESESLSGFFVSSASRLLSVWIVTVKACPDWSLRCPASFGALRAPSPSTAGGP